MSECYDFDTTLPSTFVAMFDDDPIEDNGKPLVRNDRFVLLRLESFKAVERNDWDLNGSQLTYPEMYGLFRDIETGAKFAFIGQLNDTDHKIRWISMDDPRVSLSPSFE